MRLSSISLCSLLLILKLQLTSTYPISTGLTDTDMDILKVLLSRLEESVSDQTAVDQNAPGQRDLLDSLSREDAGDRHQPDTGLDEAEIREFLSAKNLKSVRNDSSRKSSGCFGRRMDRIGSMSSLGCNTVGRYNPKCQNALGAVYKMMALPVWRMKKHNMRTEVLWGVLALLCQQTLVSSHILGRPSSANDLAQLKSLLERFEETLDEVVQKEDLEAYYEDMNQEPKSSQASQGWDQEGNQEPLISEKAQPLTEGKTVNQRSRLQDLLMATRKRTSGCFGARIDRIGNASGLGCNSGRG
ncbi:natriuretic peptides B [Astatotilapia calliptera]|nr:natriuretic peptides A [Maylandia zebra]XP_026010680.1 natriuretic peptides A [Astatotilapia calliptera]